ncbi:General secretion pathway protein E [Thermogutta terrifontis]|jgi:general secretion pathway protein E/type IV pilus assembly protein PilB|uniref:protein-secreting ATPase n=1 Tax=Thermogutta terrifontis TaxID=1331910 RepID=A0A286RII3_9BACT|nr:type II secretion system ATPase GspE [Thermogutta terrifontis]ASV75771.1 General secretion pathway protein E [Thermogutta terrifontis]
MEVRQGDELSAFSPQRSEQSDTQGLSRLTKSDVSMEAGEILVRKGLLTPQQLQLARRNQGEGRRLDQAAVGLGLLTEEEALRALGEELGIEYVDLSEVKIDPSILRNFPVKFIYRESLFPIKEENGTLVVATSDPFNLYPLDELATATGKTVVPVLASRAEIAKLIKTYLGVGGETIDELIAQSQQEEENQIELLEEIETDGSELSQLAQEPSVVRLVNEILLEAIELRASDVHIESQPSGLKIRYRIDGVLHPQPVPPEINRFQAAIISRLKIMARLNIAERRLPQDGRIQLRVAGREVDVRVSVIPMIHGEGVVLRLLDKGAMEFNLRKLGMEEDVYQKFHELINLPHGIILVTGPTGSGKTTTLYSALLEIRDESIKIITTEDPVEYQLEGINQIQVHPKIGLTFANSLRSILRHDPDVILVGEIRDLETAENAIQASLTGHLVFSTLHTNDAAGAFTRLTDMGVEPFLVSSTVEAVMAQRLVRTLCPECKEPYRPKPEELPRDFPKEILEEGVLLYRAVGCRACRHVGYKGRIGIFELLVSSERIRELAHDRASSWAIRQAAIEEGMITLRQDAWRKVLSGRTTIEEIDRVTRPDEH